MKTSNNYTSNLTWIFMMIFTVFTVLGCSEESKQTPGISDKQEVPRLKSQSAESEVRIIPDDATVKSVIYLKADKSLLNQGEIRWYVNDVSDDSERGVRFASDSLKKGDTVRVSVINDGREYNSNEIVIRNTPPVISTARLMPSVPKLSSRLTVDVDAEDADNDPIAYKYNWYINDTSAGNDSYLETELQRSDSIRVEVTPFDDESEGKSVLLKNRVYNALPVFTESEPSFDGKTYMYQVNVSDPDGDSLSYTLQEGPQNMTIDPEKGLISWEVPSSDNEEHDVKVLVSDNNGGEIVVPLRVRIYQRVSKAENLHQPSESQGSR